MILYELSQNCIHILKINFVLELITILMSGFSGHSDINKALEISLDVKRISNQLKECQTLAQLYNQRERLFGTPVTQYDKVIRIKFFVFVKSF